VVGPAGTDFVLLPSPDEGLLSSIKDTISKVRSAIQGIAAAIDDVTAAIDDIRRTITSIAGVLDDVASVVDSFTDLVEGVKSFADIPAAFVSSTANLIDSMANAAASVSGFNTDVIATFRKLGDQVDRLGTAGKRRYSTNYRDFASTYNKKVDGRLPGEDPIRDTRAQQKAADAAAGGGTLRIDQVFDGVTPGEARKTGIPRQDRARLNPNEYQGFEEKVVGQGDTLQSLAAKHLGDARKWLDIATINNLQPPYITNGAQIPQTVTTGDSIIVPITTATRPSNTLTSGEAEIGKSQAEEQLGRDYELEQIDRTGTFGWAIDAAGGSTDTRKVVGVKNLGQAIESRFRTIQGENILYPAIGLKRLVGTKAFGESLVEARYEARRQLLADTRVDQLTRFTFRDDEDKLILEADVRPVGFTTARTIARTLT
jgi:hypothetical protein